MMTLEQIRAEAMALPPQERVLLGEELLANDLSAEELAEIETSWENEAALRLEDVRAGRATLLPLEQTLRSLEQRVGL